MNACPPGVRGDVTKWLMEIQSGVYVGQLSLRAREALWQRVCKHCKTGSAIMVCSARNEQGFVYYVHNSAWETVDFDGITLMRRPLPASGEKNASRGKEEAALQSNLENSINNSDNAEKSENPPISTKTKGIRTARKKQTSSEEEKVDSEENASSAALIKSQENRHTGAENTPTAAATIKRQENSETAAENNLSSETAPTQKARKRKGFSKPLPYEPWPSNAQPPNDYVVLDLETTGLNPENDSIIEAACVRVRSGMIIEELHALISCGAPVPPTITALTGIGDELLAAEGEDIRNILPKLLTFIGTDAIVGHSTAFDIRFLQAACARLSLPPFFPTAIDTVALARERLEGKVENFRLETLARYFHILEKQTHRALPDARATAQLFSKLNENQ